MCSSIKNARVEHSNAAAAAVQAAAAEQCIKGKVTNEKQNPILLSWIPCEHGFYFSYCAHVLDFFWEQKIHPERAKKGALTYKKNDKRTLITIRHILSKLEEIFKKDDRSTLAPFVTHILQRHVVVKILSISIRRAVC